MSNFKLIYGKKKHAITNEHCIDCPHFRGWDCKCYNDHANLAYQYDYSLYSPGGIPLSELEYCPRPTFEKLIKHIKEIIDKAENNKKPMHLNFKRRPHSK